MVIVGGDFASCHHHEVFISHKPGDKCLVHCLWNAVVSRAQVQLRYTAQVIGSVHDFTLSSMSCELLSAGDSETGEFHQEGG